jgi:CubicO group peptidase (beta-lactamase class C family)
VKTPPPGSVTLRGMKTALIKPMKAFTLIALGLAIAAMGIYVANADNASSAAAPLFPRSQEVPSVVKSPAPQYAAAVGRARELVRTAVLEQNLPGVSVAVGAEGTVVWAEGFGWRDVGTKTPVTPDTKFNIGTAASRVTASVKPLGLANTGADAAKEWSPEAIGEEGEDFPPLTFLRHNVFQPLGLAPAEYPLPGDRATFYVPRSDDNPRHGRRLMFMRDLACCADGKAFYSTPSDLVRFALATNPGSVDGELAGGMVMSLMTARDSDSGNGIVVAVTSNMAYANTSSLAKRVGEAFTNQTR